MLLASTLGQLAHPFYEAFAWILANAYAVVPNYAVAIAILTLVVMIAVFPINLRGTRGMMKMQLLAPEMKKLQAKYKATPGLTVAERQDLRQRQQEEMMALYKEHNVNPTGGCLPMVIQMPVLFILYGTIRGLIHTVKSASGVVSPKPLYISSSSKIYHAVYAAGGHLRAFGIDLADSVRSPHLSTAAKIPYVGMILVAIALQYIQMKQLSGRNTGAVNPQMQQMQKIMPLFFAFFYISLPAGVNVYFIVSSLFRIGQQEFIYRRDPHIIEAMAKLRARGPVNQGKPATKSLAGPRGGLLSRLANPTSQLTPATEGPLSPAPPKPSSNGGRPRNGAQQKASPGPRSHPRAQGKRPRRAR